MINENAPHDADSRPAVGGPVERMVRPAAWALKKDGRPYMLMYERDDRSNVYSWAPLYDQAAVDAARMAGVRSVQEQTAVIVRAALELLESIEGETPFTAEALRTFKRVFGA